MFHSIEQIRTLRGAGRPIRSRGGSAGVLALIAGGGLAIGMLVGLGGCESQPSRTPSADASPVNTGLGAIGNEHGLTLPEQDDLLDKDHEQSEISDQIAESARQLEVYFANMEIDGVEPVDP
ncbi:MAG: hypothetical protein ACWA5W_09825, partial [Phycisphaerales bacterium]